MEQESSQIFWYGFGRASFGGGVNVASVIKILKALAKSMGLDPVNYSEHSSHSVRIGGANLLLNAGCDPLIIKFLGRWLYNCFEECPVLLAQGTLGVSQLMFWSWLGGGAFVCWYPPHHSLKSIQGGKKIICGKIHVVAPPYTLC